MPNPSTVQGSAPCLDDHLAQGSIGEEENLLPFGINEGCHPKYTGEPRNSTNTGRSSSEQCPPTPNSTKGSIVLRKLRSKSSLATIRSLRRSNSAPTSNEDLPGTLRKRPSISRLLGRRKSSPPLPKEPLPTTHSKIDKNGSVNHRTNRSSSTVVPCRDSCDLPPRRARQPQTLANAPCPTPQHLPPAWDRTVDIVYHTERHGAKPSTAISEFSRCVRSLLGNRREVGEPPLVGFAKLPDAIRVKIFSSLVTQLSSIDTKPISLGLPSSTKPVWRDDEFIRWGSLLNFLGPFLAVSRQFRADILATIFTTARFYIALSPYILPKTNPWSTIWISKHGRYLQNIILELDMTHFSFGPLPGAVHLGSGTLHIQDLVDTFVKSQEKRQGESTLGSLVLLCRRFHGRRPNPSLSSIAHGNISKSTSEQSLERHTSSATTPLMGDSPTDLQPNCRHWKKVQQPFYCADENLRVCDPLMRLRGLVRSIRICGFSNEYTLHLIKAIFVVPTRRKVDTGEGQLKLVARVPNASEDTVWGAVQLCAPIVSKSGDTRIPPAFHMPRLETIDTLVSSSLTARESDIEGLAERIAPSKERVTSLLRKFSSSRKTTL